MMVSYNLQRQLVCIAEILQSAI